MFSQATIDDAVNWLTNQYTGQVIAFPDGRYKGECSAPIVWYFNHLGIPVPVMFNNRADGWGVKFPQQLAPYFTLEAFNVNKTYPRGSVMMWDSPHIAVVIHDAPGNVVQVFQQNADPDGSACASKARVTSNQFRKATYVLLPIIKSSAPAPAPTPAPPVSTVPAPPLRPAGNPDNTYTVIKEVPGFGTATNAGNHASPVNKVVPGDYYVFNTHPKNANLINVTFKLGVPGSWINKADNVIPPPAPPTPPPAPVEPPAPVLPPETVVVPEVVEPVAPAEPSWKDTYAAFPAPIRFMAARPMTVKDLDDPTRQMLPLPKYAKTERGEVGVVNAYGTVIKDGIYHYRVRIFTDTNFDFWYCIPKIDPDTRTANLLAKPTTPGKPVTKGQLARDTMVLAKSHIETGFPKFLDDILPKWLKPKK